jgi:hypothetical protein
MEKMSDKMNISISLWKTFVFLLICVFFTIVAWGFDLKYSFRFRKVCKYKKYNTEKLKKMLSDFEKLISCEDPYIENFFEKHQELSTINPMWLFILSWQKKIKKELQRRGEIVA